MADLLYPLGKEAILNGDIDIDTDTIKVALVDLTADYTYSAAHQFKSSVTSYSGTTDQTVTPITKTSGTVDSSGSPTFSSVSQSSTKTVGALVVYKDTGAAATSPLIAYIDITSPVTPNGGDISITWNASGIFAI